MKHLVWLLSLSILAACGGGGGGSSAPADTDPDPEQPDGNGTTTVQRISLTGLAVKGLAKGAQIDAFVLQGNAFSNTTSATAITGADGGYSLEFAESLDSYTGPVKVVMTYRDGAMLQCDDPSGCDFTGGNAAFEDFYAMPADFTLASVANIGDGLTSLQGDTIVNLTALTTLATALVEDDAITGDSVDAGNNQIRAVFSLPASVDLSATAPANIADESSPGDDIYGAINAAFLKIANDDDKELSSVISDYAAVLVANGGQMVLKEETDGDPSLLEVTTAAIALNTLEGAELTKIEAAKTTANDAVAGVVTDINPPSIDAGADKTVTSGDSVSITASVVIGTADTYLWQVISGSLDLTGNASAATATLTFTAPTQGGDIALRVIAEDSAGSGADNDIVIVTVNPILATTITDNGNYVFSLMGHELFGKNDGLHSGQELEILDMAVNLGATGSGNLEFAVGDSVLEYGFYSNLSTVDTITLNTRQTESGTQTEVTSMPITQLAGGTINFSTPESESVEGNTMEVNAASDFRFFKFSEGFFTSMQVESDSQYPVVNGIRDTANILETQMQVNAVTLARKHTLSGMADFNGREFIGFEMRKIENANTNLWELQIQKSDLSFTSGALTSNNLGGKKLFGLPNKDFGSQAAFTMQDILPEAGSPESTTSSVMIEGGFTNIVNNDAFYHYVAEDFTALSVSGLYWENASADFELTNPTPRVNENTSALFIEKGEQYNLNGKRFNIRAIEHKIVNTDNTSNAVAPRVVFKEFEGELSFVGATGTFDFVAQESSLEATDGTVASGSYKIEHQHSTEVGSPELIFESDVTDANGCAKTSDGFEFCFNGKGALVGTHSYADTNVDPNGKADELALWYIIGQQIIPLQSNTFATASVPGSYDLTFIDGVAPYTFAADFNGTVTFPGDQTAEAFTWSVDAEGRLIVNLAGGEVDRYTLVSGDASTGSVKLEIDGGKGYRLAQSSLGSSWVKN